MKKNNTAEKTILDAEKITKALKESTEKSLRDIMNEAISNLVQEGDDDIEEVEDDSYEEEDVPTSDAPAVEDNGSEGEGDAVSADNADMPEGGEEGAEDSADADDEWSDMEQYKVGDNDYDFTGVDGDEVLKVYNKLGDDDQIFVKKEDDGTYSVKDDETGAEFVIELDPEALGAEADSNNVEGGSEEGGEEAEFELGDEFGGEEEGDNFGGEGGEDFGDEPVDDNELEIDINGEDDDDDDELYEGIGYTDSYQKDVFAKKFNMNEPANSKATYSMDDGAPEGDKKPWAGKGDMKPFGKKTSVDECDGANCAPANPNMNANLEEAGLELRKASLSKSGTRAPKGHIDYMSKNSHNVHDGSESGKTVTESIQKIINAAKAIQAENKQYKECINKIKGSLYEAAVLNVNLGKLVDILVNETTTKDEKKRICERFNNVKTIAEGKTLYTTIKSELSESKKSAPAVEKQFVAESKNLNETTIYQNSNDPSIDLMNRMDNLFKK